MSKQMNEAEVRTLRNAGVELLERAERAEAELTKLQAECTRLRIGHSNAAARAEKVEAERDRLKAALEQIDQWSKAYPLDIFPEPDLKKAHEVLTAHDMTLDAISASNMRHVVEGVGKIASAALSGQGQQT